MKHNEDSTIKEEEKEGIWEVKPTQEEKIMTLNEDPTIKEEEGEQQNRQLTPTQKKSAVIETYIKQ